MHFGGVFRYIWQKNFEPSCRMIEDQEIFMPPPQKYSFPENLIGFSPLEGRREVASEFPWISVYPSLTIPGNRNYDDDDYYDAKGAPPPKMDSSIPHGSHQTPQFEGGGGTPHNKGRPPSTKK